MWLPHANSGKQERASFVACPSALTVSRRACGGAEMGWGGGPGSFNAYWVGARRPTITPQVAGAFVGIVHLDYQSHKQLGDEDSPNIGDTDQRAVASSGEQLLRSADAHPSSTPAITAWHRWERLRSS